MDFRELSRALRRKLGAVEDRQSHHVFFWMEADGRDYRIAKFSHSSRGQVPDFITSDSARRLKLTNAELDQLVECPLTGDACRELWRIR